jgi:hypothetical protein
LFLPLPHFLSPPLFLHAQPPSTPWRQRRRRARDGGEGCRAGGGPTR